MKSSCRMFHCSLLIILLKQSNSDSVFFSKSMIVTYGKPLNYSLNYETYPTNLWDSCVRYCYLLDSCVAAHSPVSPFNCEIFSANQLWSVKRMNSSQEQLMAIKIHSPSTICPVSMDSVLSYGEVTHYPYVTNIQSLPHQGSSSDPSSDYDYFITQNDPEDTWYISYQSKESDTFSRMKTTDCCFRGLKMSNGVANVSETTWLLVYSASSWNTLVSDIRKSQSILHSFTSRTTVLSTKCSIVWTGNTRRKNICDGNVTGGKVKSLTRLNLIRKPCINNREEHNKILHWEQLSKLSYGVYKKMLEGTKEMSSMISQGIPDT
ncbi:hypothetical protein CRE_06163 [Caenorhabditis remanei]|uniref:PAN-3 domain-containing protein n=1 Tax=Caenorhabditis remanei TaxID=31234 RepID=E3NIF7_CAERE|nr:hypothetical protein CRE_06163 [Caenorhabditis remanei]